jgi:alkanesulfonate monooxygenase SsuD/methylene tetrahydromethanopterin reductase-like flavin-dependent oxidoreductase (luciferase family)
MHARAVPDSQVAWVSCLVRPFRFAFQATSTHPAELVRSAQAAEERGSHLVQIGDHIGAEPGLLTSLTAMAFS